MGGYDVNEGVKILRSAHIPNFSFPDEAVRVFNYLHKLAARVQHIKEPTFAIPPNLGFDLEVYLNFMYVFLIKKLES
jgi:acyl-CoA synthetase (NDP forming)